MICGGVVCALHVRTAGLSGAALASDEEEVVYLAYIIIDVLSNKIVGASQYPVRPTRRPSEELQSGVTLEVAIAQFDSYIRSLQLDPHSPLFRLVTDGQPTLRQCLHPEACGKGLALPAYYARFHDLRKEFVRAYTLRAVAPPAPPAPPPPPPPDHPVCVADMVNYLGITPYEGEDFYAREVKDMANIIQRIISDGYRLELPETIDLVLETGICSKDDEIEGNCIVRARGLPWQSSDQDIAKFFRGLNVAKGGVALCLSPQGRRNGEALVRFVSQEHRDMALKRHKHHMGNRYIEVYPASGEDFLGVAGGASSEAASFLSRGAQVIVRMRGLPYDCTPQQVLEFFSTGEEPVTVLDGAEGVLFVRRADGRATGDAFVLFAREDDAPKALTRHRRLIGARYIELFRSTTAEVQQVLNRSLEARPSSSSASSEVVGSNSGLVANVASVPLVPQHVITSGTLKDCVRLRGLPYEAHVEHILNFLDDFAKNIVFQGVHMVYNAQGQPSGEAFIQMDSESSAYLCAQQKHHRYMTFGKKQRYIEVFQCSGDDMNLVLTGGIAAPVSPGKVLPPPGTLLSAPPTPPAAASARLLAHHIAQQSLLARQHDQALLAASAAQLAATPHFQYLPLFAPPAPQAQPAYNMKHLQPTPSQLFAHNPYLFYSRLPQPTAQRLPTQFNLFPQAAMPVKRSYEQAFAQEMAQAPKRHFPTYPSASPSVSSVATMPTMPTLPMFSPAAYSYYPSL